MARKLLVRLVLPLIIVAAGGGAAWAIFAAAPTAAESEPEDTAPLVEVVEVRSQPTQALVSTTGMVVAAKQATLTPEVSGRVVDVSSALLPGGRVSEGDPLVRIDPRDYRLAVEQQGAQVAKAELDLTAERGRRSVAKREWEMLGRERPAEDSPLALRVPQLRTAEANLRAARSGLRKARLNLSRTVIRAPWDAMVVEDFVEVGQVVSPGTKVATLVGTDRVWVTVSVPLERLPDIEVPGINGEAGSPAEVIHELSQRRRVQRPGRVLRLKSRLDEQTRTAQLLIEVEEPFDRPEAQVPLLPGSYVQVEIHGRTVPSVFDVPRAAVREGSHVWVVNDQGRLERRDIQIGWGTDHRVFVIEGLEPGAQVVTTKLSSPIQGMEVGVRQGDGGPSATPGAPPAPGGRHGT